MSSVDAGKVDEAAVDVGHTPLSEADNADNADNAELQPDAVAGIAVRPLYASVPLAAAKDAALSLRLALFDAARVPGVRERNAAAKMLGAIFHSDSFIVASVSQGDRGPGMPMPSSPGITQAERQPALTRTPMNRWSVSVSLGHASRPERTR